MRKFIIILVILHSSHIVVSQCDTMNIHYQKAIKYYQKKDYDKAYFYFNKAIEDEPNLAKAYYYKANILVNLKEDSIALIMLDKAIQIEPEYVEAYYLKAYLCFYYPKNDQNDPLIEITKAIKLNSQNADAYQLRSAIYVDIGEDSLAFNDINIAIEIKPQNAYYYYSRGSIKQSFKDKKGACEDFAIAKKLGFDKMAIKIKETEYCNKTEK